MNALDYILANYQQEKYQTSLAERGVLRALVHTLKKEELLILQKKLKRGSSKWSVGKVLCDESTKVLGKRYPKKNESISTLLKAFTDKQSGKVAEARAELRDRFDKQSFQTQRKILQAMLSASKQDRVWAYKQLSNGWDDFFFEDVKNLWEQYHEKECVAVIIKHFPMEYVYENLSALDTHGNYTNLCIKLIHHPKFQIDKERLKEDFVFYGYPEVEYLYILAKSKSKIEKGEATRILYEQMIISLNCEDGPYDSQSTAFKRGFSNIGYYENYYPTTKWLDVVSHILWCMGKLGLTEELVAYEEWDSMVQRRFIYSSDYEELKKYCGTDFHQECYLLFRNVIAECLPDEYKHLIRFPYSPVNKVDNKPKMSIDELKSDSTLSTLIDQLGLEVAK